MRARSSFGSLASTLLPALLMASLASLGGCSESQTPAGSSADAGSSGSLSGSAAATSGSPSSGDTKPETDEQKLFYALGAMVARSVERFELKQDELAWVTQGFEDAALGHETAVDPKAYVDKMTEFFNARAEASSTGEVVAAAAFVAEKAAAEGAVQSESGVVMTEVAAGEGDSPSLTDTVEVHYHGTLRDGTVFDSSVDRGTPAKFRVNGVIPCWQEAIPKMRPGGKAQLVCPPDTAYGNRATGKIPGGAALVFDVELISVAP